MDIETEQQKFKEALMQVQSASELQELKTRYLGKKGLLRQLTKDMKTLTPDEKKELGQLNNRLKQDWEEQIRSRQEFLTEKALREKLQRDWFDFSLSDSLTERSQFSGAYHPITLIQRELEDIFLAMGFQILDGPHIEDDYHNFEALNIPSNHPARDMQDTFWFRDSRHLLRTHTSAVQIRGMEQAQPPFRFVAPGKVFRSEATDASHEITFHQMEGMMVDRGITVSHLIYFMKTLLKEIFRQDVEFRLRPGYFPFVEPGFELDISCLVCGGNGCSVCKRTGWLELLPCGLTHPNTLRYGGIDPEEYRGFAFGLGLDRLVMMRYRINDIRYFHSGNLSFLQQFRNY